jgi:hypothetical protein
LAGIIDPFLPAIRISYNVHAWLTHCFHEKV